MKNELSNGWVKHVIYLMLENRGFDHFLGWLYPTVGNQPPVYQVNSYAGDQRPFMGLSDALIAQLTNPYPKGMALAAQPVIKGARSPKTPSYNSGEDFLHIMNQVWGLEKPGTFWTDPNLWGPKVQELKGQAALPPMNGYILDFNLELKHSGVANPEPDQLKEILETYEPAQLPVLAGLARSFAVSDEWYCSVPSQTNTNRAFSLTGTSRGLVNNNFYRPDTYNPMFHATRKFVDEPASDTLPRSTGSLFEVMQASGYDWKIFWQSEWPPIYATGGVSWQYTRTLIPALEDSQFDDNFVRFDGDQYDNALFQAIRNQTLPALTFIEPKWGGGKEWDTKFRLVGNDYHSVSDTTVSEDFLRRLYQVLSASDPNGDTLLIITFDENGGTYDHVPPPAAPAPANQSVPLPHAPHGGPGLYDTISPTAQGVNADDTTRTQFGFDFKSYGIRVPTILVSNRLPPKTVFRSTVPGKVFDHTSIIASVLEMANIPRERWLLGERVAQAPTFTHLFTAPQPPPIVVRPPPLSLPDRRSMDPKIVQGFAPVKLAYVGSLWPQAAPPSSFLGPPKKWGIDDYPTLVGPGEAAAYFLAPVENSVSGAITNMSRLRILSKADGLGASNALCVRGGVTSTNTVFFTRPTNEEGELWEIRLLQSREESDVIHYGDYVAFFNRTGKGTDPFRRLTPNPGDRTYLTAAAGEWSLWQIQSMA